MRTIRTKIVACALLNFGARGVPLQIGLAGAPLRELREVGRKGPQTKAACPNTNSKAGIIDRSSAKAQEKRKRPARQTAFFLIRSSQTGMTTKWVDEQVRLSHTLLKQ